MNQDATRIAVVLDRSGSMESVRDATIAGFNEYINGQKLAAGSATVLLTQFDNIIDFVFDCPLSAVPALTRETFVPRGATALLDAIGLTINALGKQLESKPEAERPGKVIVVIVTDGEENASREFSLAQIHNMITHQREKYAWDFIFLGANQDAIQNAGKVGIDANAALRYSANAAGTAASFAAASRVSRDRRDSAALPCFSSQDRLKADLK